MRLRRNRTATGEVNQALAAMVVIMMCVGAVMAAVHAATGAAHDRSLQERAREQAQLVLDALSEDPALQGRSGALSLSKAQQVRAGNATLAFHPAGLRVAALRAVSAGDEVLMVGQTVDLGARVLLVSEPVAVELDDGRVLPGILRVGVAVE
jgi:hypothetical protein